MRSGADTQPLAALIFDMDGLMVDSDPPGHASTETLPWRAERPAGRVQR